MVILNLGLSDPRRLHHTTQVQPQCKNKVMVRYTRGKVNTTSAFTPKIGPLGLSPRNVGDSVAKGASGWKGLRVTVKLAVQNRQTQIRWFPLPLPCSPKPSGSHREPEGSRKTLNTMETSPVMRLSMVLDKTRHWSLARECSGTLMEIPGTVQSLGCSVDGCHPVTS